LHVDDLSLAMQAQDGLWPMWAIEEPNNMAWKAEAGKVTSRQGAGTETVRLHILINGMIKLVKSLEVIK